MKLSFVLKCFAIGMSAASGVGPIFVLTFNRGALRGFTKGFATAVGSAFGDALLFFLGLIGLLGLLQGSRNLILILDLIGGVTLVALGFHMIKNSPASIKENTNFYESFSRTTIKSFLLTIINPLAVIFFLIVSVQLIPAGQKSLPLYQVFTGSIIVGLGSLIALSLVAFFASKMGKSLSSTYLSKVSFFTGVLFIGIGMYFFRNVILIFIKFMNS